MPKTALLIGRSTAFALLFPVVLAGSACSGALGHRSVEEISGSIPLGDTIRKVRLELRNGTIGIDSGEARAVAYAGGVRRAANTAEELRAIEAVPLVWQAEADPEDPAVLVLRPPAEPDGLAGILAYELGIHIPPGIELEIAVERNGHLTVANREAPLRCTTGRGDLCFLGCRGGVKARTGRGQVLVNDHRGDLDITAAAGSIQAFVPAPGAQLRLDTGEGNVQCYLPPSAGFRVDARAKIGKCGSSYGLTVEHPSAYSAVMRGQRGDGHTRIVMRTGKGTLTLEGKDFD